MQVVLILTLLLSLFWVVYATRDTSKVMLFLLGSISIAAVLLTVWQRVFGMVPSVWAQLIITVTLIALAATFRRRRLSSYPRADFAVILPIATLVVAGVLAVARVVTLGENPLLFTGAGRLAFAEDNAKWLNFAANLAQDNLLNFKDGTTGGLAVLLVICSAAAWIFSVVVLGGVNVAGISIAAVLLAHAALIVIAPLALSPIVTKYFSTTSEKKSEKFSGTTFPVVTGLIVAVLLAVSAVGAASTFGHLSLEIVMVQLLFWLSAMVYLWNSRSDLLLVTLIGASTALIWLPLPPLAVGISLAAVVLAILRWRQSRVNADGRMAVAILVVGAVIVWLTTPEVQYLSATTQPSTSTDLVFAEGGTMAAKRFELLLLGIALVGSALYCWVNRARITLASVWRIYPVLLLLGFSVAVFAYDFIVAADGWPHYGARKLGYLVVTVVAVALLPLAFEGFQLVTKGKKWLLYGAAGTSVVALLLSQTFTQASHYTFKRDAWVNLDLKKIDGVLQPDYWVNVVNPRNQAESPLERIPIACVQVVDGVIQPGISDQYFCTRFLLSLHGAEAYTNALFYPVLVAPSEGNVAAMRELPSDVLQLEVLVLDENGLVTARISVEEYIQLYAVQSPELYEKL